MEEQVKKLREAGFSDADIQEWMKENQSKEGAVAPTTAEGEKSVPFAVTPTQAPPGESALETAATAIQGVNSLIDSPLGHAAEAAGGAWLGKKTLIDPLAEAIRGRAAGPVPPAGPSGPANVSKLVVPQNVGSGPRPVAPSGSAQQMWNTLKTPPPAAPAQPPVGGPAAAEGSTFIQRMSQLAGKYAPMASRVAGGIGAMVTPGNIGQNYAAQFPQTGPQRGSEINPATGRPWTREELVAYNTQYQ